MLRLSCLLLISSTVANGALPAFSTPAEIRLFSRGSTMHALSSSALCKRRSARRSVANPAVMQADLPPPGMVTNSNDIDWRGLQQVGDDWVRYGPKLEENNRNEADLPEPRWYIVQCTPGLEDNVKMVLHSKINNSPWLQKTILEVLVPTTKVSKVNSLSPALLRTIACDPPVVTCEGDCSAAGSQWQARVPA
jgi:hypothetical protein